MTKITYAELSAKFVPEPVPGVGTCCVVPGFEFDPDWEFYLDVEGYVCHNTTLNGKGVTLVYRKGSAVKPPAPVVEVVEQKPVSLHSIGRAWR